MKGARKLSVAAVVAGIAFALSACGSSTSSSSSPSAGSSSSSTAGAAATTSASGITVPAAVKRSGVLNVATFLDYPPYDYLSASGQPAGIEVELVSAVAQKLGLKPEIHNLQFEALIPAVSNGRYDFATAPFEDTQARQKQVVFLDWLNLIDKVLTEKGNPNHINPSDLCGRSFAESTGSVEATVVFPKIVASCVKAGQPRPTLLQFADIASQAEAVVTGRAQLTMIDPGVGTRLAQKSGKLEVLPQTIPQVQPVPGGWVFARNDAALAKAVGQAIEVLAKDGTWQRILSNGGVESQAILPPKINGQPLG